ncbi:hypothetical protein HAX54_008340 [Datura stramonium]|uniref:VPS37 C-terminal domain-containing protein n=1 Tax=Datura stramonium TaxID=4076 RepID=A0ABS8TD38_DATST|nr:hypothetical protein [Datura stramonium]
MKSIALFVRLIYWLHFFHRSSYVQIIGAEEQQAQPSPQPSNASWPSSMSHVSPAEAADIIAALKNKSVNELRSFILTRMLIETTHSLEAVKTQNNHLTLAVFPISDQVRDELLNETLQLARENLEKEPWIMELRNQLQDAMKKAEEESEALLVQLLDREIDLTTFVQKYKKLGCSYHKRALTHLAAKASLAA